MRRRHIHAGSNKVSDSKNIAVDPLYNGNTEFAILKDKYFEQKSRSVHIMKNFAVVNSAIVNRVDCIINELCLHCVSPPLLSESFKTDSKGTYLINNTAQASRSPSLVQDPSNVQHGRISKYLMKCLIKINSFPIVYVNISEIK